MHYSNGDNTCRKRYRGEKGTEIFTNSKRTLKSAIKPRQWEDMDKITNMMQDPIARTQDIDSCGGKRETERLQKRATGIKKELEQVNEPNHRMLEENKEIKKELKIQQKKTELKS